MISRPRVSKSWNGAITQLSKIFNNLQKIWSNELETGKTETTFMCLSQFDKGFLVSHVLM